MTKKQKYRRNDFSADSNVGEEDFTLVDLDVMLDQEEPSPVPLNHVFDDEETIDRLLINSNSGFDVNDELEGIDRKPDALVIDDIELTDDFPDLGQFSIEPVEQPEEERLTGAKEIPVPDIYSRADHEEIPDEEDAIDRLLVDAGFDVNDELEEIHRKPDALVIDDIELADDFSDLDKFSIEPVEQAEQNRLTGAEEIPVLNINSRADYDELQDEDAIDKLLIDADDDLKGEAGAANALVIDDASWANDFGVNFKEKIAMAADKSNFDSGESELVLDKEPINAFRIKEENHETVKHEQAFSETTNQEEALCSLNDNAGMAEYSSFISGQEAIKKQIKGYEEKVKKAAIIIYASLSFGIVALLSTVVMGVIVSNLQAKVSKLTELVSIIEEDMSGVVEKNADMGIDDNDSSIEHSNRKVNGPSEPGNPRTSESVLEKKKQSEATAGKVSAEKKVELPKHVIEQSQSLLEQSKSNAAAIATKQATLDKSIDKKKTKNPVLDKKKPSETTLKTTSINKKTSNAKAASAWSVNLTAYKELSDAKGKAAKYIQKGIPVELIPVDKNNTKWYRLRVGGFKNKEKADSYAAKIKKLLNLDAVFVGNT